MLCSLQLDADVIISKSAKKIPVALCQKTGIASKFMKIRNSGKIENIFWIFLSGLPSTYDFITLRGSGYAAGGVPSRCPEYRGTHHREL